MPVAAASRAPQAAPLDIEHDIRRVLKEDLDFQGHFSIHKTYPNAPNPLLSLDGLGLVGLPLGPSAAKTVIAHCDQAPFGKGERTIVDKELRDTWEMDAIKVNFRNPAWKAFMAGVARDVCDALAVNFLFSRPRVKLYKLLLYETGSHFLPHVDTEREDGMFASVVVVLPSEFTGGDVHTSHCGIEVIHDSSKDSITQTTVLAWYTDVKHEVKPITSGYRFVLAYNIMHTTSIRPTLSSSTTDAIDKLRKIFHSWNTSKSSPDQISYLLEHQYSQANLSASALKGVDAHIVAVLNSLAREMGFGLGLANLELTMNGEAADTNPYPQKRRRWGYDSESESDTEPRPAKLQFSSVKSMTISVHNVVDLDGIHMDQDLAPNKSLVKQLKAQGRMTQEYEDYMGNCAASLDRYYRSSVLVIWPRWSGIGDRRTTQAQQRLRIASSKLLSPTELEDFEYLCQTIRFIPDEDQQGDLFQHLLRIALARDDISLWQKAVNGHCGGDRSLDQLSIERLQEAREAFGFDAIANILRPLIQGNLSNTRLEYAINLYDLKEDHTDAAQIDAFVYEMRQYSLNNLQLYRSSDELQLYTQELWAEGGAQLVHDQLVPQIQSRTARENISALEHYLEWFWAADEELSNSYQIPQSITIRKQIIATLLKTLISRRPLYAVKPVKVLDQTVSHAPKQVKIAQGDPMPAVSLIGKCLDYENSELVLSVLRKMNQAAARLADEYNQSKTEARVVPEVVFPLVPTVQNLLRLSTPPITPAAHFELETLAESALKIKLEVLRDLGGVTHKDLVSLFDFVQHLKNIDYLVDFVVAGLAAQPWDEYTCLEYLEELQKRCRVNQATFERPMRNLAQLYARNVSLCRLTHPSNIADGRFAEYATCAEALSRCWALGGPEAFSTLMERILHPPSPDEHYLVTIALRLISHVENTATQHGFLLTQAPFSTSFMGIITEWMKHVLGPTPPNLHRARAFLASIDRISGCCQNCMQVIGFLRNARLAEARLRVMNTDHVIAKLSQDLSSSHVTFNIVRAVPQGILVAMSSELFQAVRWIRHQAEGRRLLAIFPDEMLRTIWGDTYEQALAPLLPIQRTTRQSVPTVSSAPFVHGTMAVMHPPLPAHAAPQAASNNAHSGPPLHQPLPSAHEVRAYHQVTISKLSRPMPVASTSQPWPGHSEANAPSQHTPVEGD
ncbi:hypothetical protein MIND_00779600 [Mycena indigotica]|uniref:Prolyl 4-hydroxylase alpha subunit Fe(2+) 2OG dioxygenase domain-containing protein n=1 Tax=Mycena indigotica TaxID=2126181 RepID=A0A8H6SM34_9AGAR|nr:uncharacterized protein MIND_00779600 [Mycena indigotica]KAF7302128.1 hypothetical protein MIND_00779600 [Mycena indigotica]